MAGSGTKAISRAWAANWRAAVPGPQFKPYGYGTFLDLDRDPDAEPLGQGSSDRAQGVDLRQRDLGVNHVALNLKMARRPAVEIMDELANTFFPLFNRRLTAISSINKGKL